MSTVSGGVRRSWFTHSAFCPHRRLVLRFGSETFWQSCATCLVRYGDLVACPLLCNGR
jgi:hypothetical protein